jgi:hypothetical protein
VVNIVEIAPPSEGTKVPVLGHEFVVWGITGRGWAALAKRYPELKRKLAGLEVAPEDMTVYGMESTPAIIVMALKGREKMSQEEIDELEDTIDRLPPAAQTALMQAVMEASFPPDPTKGDEAPKTPKSPD